MHFRVTGKQWSLDQRALKFPQLPVFSAPTAPPSRAGSLRMAVARPRKLVREWAGSSSSHSVRRVSQSKSRLMPFDLARAIQGLRTSAGVRPRRNTRVDSPSTTRNTISRSFAFKKERSERAPEMCRLLRSLELRQSDSASLVDDDNCMPPLTAGGQSRSNEKTS